MDLLNYLEILSLAALLGLMIWRRLVGKWPSIFTACAFELIFDLTMMGMIAFHAPYSIYFYVYWIGTGLLALARFWISADILRRFPGIGFMPFGVHIFIGIMAVTMAGASFSYWHHLTPKVTNDIRGTAILLNECANIALAAFSIVFLFLVRILNIGWDVEGIRLATGVFLRVCSNLIVGTMLGTKDFHIGNFLIGHVVFRKTANALDSACWIAILFLWNYYLVTFRPEPQMDITILQRHYAAALTLISEKDR